MHYLNHLRIDSEEKKIVYFGIPVHNNLGDQAQGVCIRKWLKKHYINIPIVEIETNAVVNTMFPIIRKLKHLIKDDDFFVFQSGYTTTDLGGYADLMHRTICLEFPNNKKLMMPQTVFFKNEKNKMLTASILNADKNLLFLARDSISYHTALEMFPDINVMLFPDIVTTLIGTLTFSNKREGILFCLRDDTEKFYPDSELELLISKCKSITDRIERTDTTKRIARINFNAEQHILDEISNYSNYKLIVTDRYHGTIFALAANTPVVILKTTDHKVITGADWFKGVLDEYVFVAEDLNSAFELIHKLYYNSYSCAIDNYFEKKYYDKLADYFNKGLANNVK